MQRRNFIRLMGGGAASAVLAGCSRGPAANRTADLAAWLGPSPGTEPRRWALSYAILAPSAGNVQPWLVDLREPGQIVLRVDEQRLLPGVDPCGRQAVISQGTFIELLLMALQQRGVEAVVDLFPDGEFAPHRIDDRPVARIRWLGMAPAEVPASAPDTLFGHIVERRTARQAFDSTREVQADEVLALATERPAGAPGHLHAMATNEPRWVTRLKRLTLDAAFAEAAMPWPGPVLSRPRADSGIDARLRQLERQVRSASAFAWISTAAPPGTNRRAEVWAGRCFVRQQLRATALGLQLLPLSHALEATPERASQHDELQRLLAGGVGSGRSVQMLCSVGHGQTPSPSPRFPLDSLLMG